MFMASSRQIMQHEISRQDIQAAMAKAVELRAIHAALVHGSSPGNARVPSSPSSSLSRASQHFSAHDYPVFTPTYEEEGLGSGYHRRLPGLWDGSGVEKERGSEVDERSSLSARKETVLEGEEDGAMSSLFGSTVDSKLLRDNPCFNHNHVSTGGEEIYRSELRPVTTCNACRPATINRERGENSELIVVGAKSLEYPPASLAPPPPQLKTSSGAGKGPIFSWLFPKTAKKKLAKTTSPASPSRGGDGSPGSYASGEAISVECLRRELQQATEGREAALAEAAEMRSSLNELQQRLLSLDNYCNELRKALRQPKRAGLPPPIPTPTPSVTQEALADGFCQMASETRASVKQFCKALVGQIDDADDRLMEKLNCLLQPHNLTMASKYSKGVLYHMEAAINHCLHQDFENTVFQPSGAAKLLDPHHDRRTKFQSFAALRHLSWSEVLRKGTKYYSDEFSRFCDQKMGSILAALDWSRPWPEQLLQSFFVAAKCVWLLHLLAFSFSPPAAILRVEENRGFDPLYMEDVLPERQRSRAPARVKVMIAPGFYVDDKVLRCRVLCRYKTIS